MLKILSHSGRGSSKWQGPGARSVLVSLWALDGDSFHEFMKYFYTQPEKGQNTSKSLNLARKSMRESGNFRKMKTSFEKLHVIRCRACVNNIHEDVKRGWKHSCYLGICSGSVIDVYSYAP